MAVTCLDLWVTILSAVSFAKARALWLLEHWIARMTH